jgi:hypothetical protein
LSRDIFMVTRNVGALSTVTVSEWESNEKEQ